MNVIQNIVTVIRQAFEKWNLDQAPRLAAAIAYYTAFSIAPLVVLVIALVGVVFNEQVARAEVIAEIESVFGASGAELVAGLIDSATRPAEGIISTILSLAALLFGALGAFGALQGALDTIWGVELRPFSWRSTVRDKLLSFGMVLIVGFLLLVSMVVSTALSAISTYVLRGVGGGGGSLQTLNFAISFAIILLLFALMFKFLPHTHVRWSDVWAGAAVTTLLFSLGRYLLSWYLGTTSITSAYGAAGSLALILLWIYYSAQILLFGAEFTTVYAKRRAARRQERLLQSQPVESTNAPVL